MAQVEKSEKTANLVNSSGMSERQDCPEYETKDHQQCVAHLKIVKDEKIGAMFFGLKESYGVYFNGEYVGIVERPRGNQMWNAYPKGQRSSSTKRTAKTPAAAAWALIEERINQTLVVKESETVQ
jgi:hypothetical protein